MNRYGNVAGRPCNLQVTRLEASVQLVALAGLGGLLGLLGRTALAHLAMISILQGGLCTLSHLKARSRLCLLMDAGPGMWSDESLLMGSGCRTLLGVSQNADKEVKTRLSCCQPLRKTGVAAKWMVKAWRPLST